ncbi:metallophosphoesterase [Georgenia muralis]|nr:metallophosphoesterase [Georgenia muralis]
MSDPVPMQRRWAWWHRQTPTTRRVLRTAATLLVTGLLALAVGVSTASTRASLGPHEADYQVTLDRQATVELGPLGAVVADSPLPWPLGIKVVVREIPLQLGTTGSPMTGLLADLQAYAQLFSHPEAAVAAATRGLVADALGRTAVVWSVALVLIAAGRLASQGLLRDHVRAALARPGVTPLGVVASLALVAAVIVPAVQQRPVVGLSPPVLDGTPMEGVQITGRLADLIATYGHVLRDAYEENEEFYALASQNLRTALAEDDQSAPVAPPPLLLDDATGTPETGPVPVDGAAGRAADPDADAVETPAPGADAVNPPPAGPDAAEPDAPLAEPGDTPSEADAPLEPGGTLAEPDAAGVPGGASPEDEPEPEPEPEPVTFVLVSDLHCNVGMADVITAAVDAFAADAVLDAGDTVVSGSSVESYCVDAFAGAVPGGVPIVVATGNHDSVTTAEQERAAGWTVLGGDVVDVAGVRILGDTDPNLTAIGAGTRPERDETIPEMAERLARTACDARDDGDPVDLLLTHNPRAGTATMESGCVPLQLSGHWHRTVGPEPLGAGLRYVSTSTGGGAGGGATVGPLTSDAELTVLRIDRATGEPMDYRRILVGTDASVRLGTWFRFPEPETRTGPGTDGGEAVEPGPDDAGTGPGADGGSGTDVAAPGSAG